MSSVRSGTRAGAALAAPIVLVLVLVSFALAAGCSEESLPGDRSAAPGATAPGAAGGGPASGTAAARERTVHVRASLELEGGLDVAATLAAVRDDVERRGGYLEASARSSDDRAELEIRVPAAELEGLREAIAAHGRVARETEDVEDVTFARIDVDARLRSVREEERRLLALYADRTASLADVLAVERELARVRGEVERLDAESRTLADRVAMARVSLEVRRAPVSFASDPLGTLAGAAGGGLGAAWTVLVAAVVVALAVTPTLAVLAGLALLARRALRVLRGVA